MVDIAAFSRRVRRWAIASGIMFFGSALMMLVDFTTRLPTAEKGEFAAVWLFGMGVGVFFYYRSLELPMKELVAFAQAHNGVLTVSEICTGLNISPELAVRTLKRLHAAGLAQPNWSNLDKNQWEFPDILPKPEPTTHATGGAETRLEGMSAADPPPEADSPRFSDRESN